MTFKLKNLKFFLKQIENNHINQVNIKSNNFNMIINKYIINQYKFSTTSQVVQSPTLYKNQNKNITFIKKQESENIENKIININESETYSTIISPMVGTFYRSSAPNEPAFIENNDIVEKKQTVCIIEAMKLMNEIEAEVRGEIVEILVKDGDIVDCGQALMKVKHIK